MTVAPVDLWSDKFKVPSSADSGPIVPCDDIDDDQAPITCVEVDPITRKRLRPAKRSPASYQPFFGVTVPAEQMPADIGTHFPNSNFGLVPNSGLLHGGPRGHFIRGFAMGMGNMVPPPLIRS